MKFEVLPVDRIRPSPFQPRESFPRETIVELADSIKGSGLIQPILVRKKGETYEIIAGERRWRAAQFAGLKEIPAIIREADDLQARELSLIENWHRLALQTIETERFIAELYSSGIESGLYKSLNDMANKTGIPQQTLSELINARKERKELNLPPVVTYTDIRETRVIKDKPELRKHVLKLREEGKLSRDALREFSRAVKNSSAPVRLSLLELKINPEEARIIESELTSQTDKIRTLEMIERERKPERIVSLVKYIKELEEKRRMEIIEEADTGDVWQCPICDKKYRLIHVKPSGGHRFEEVRESRTSGSHN